MTSARPKAQAPDTGTSPLASPILPVLLEERELKWLQISASMVSLIGLAGLMALLAQSAFAQDRAGGFQSGKPFSNPFANSNPGGAGAPPPPPPGGNNNFFDDEDGDELDYPEGGMTSGNPPPPPPGRGGSGAPGGGADPMANQGTVQVGGGTPGGVISHSNVRSLRIDDETGEGSRDVVTDFNYPDADIMDIAKTLGKLTGKNFIIDKDVKGRITIISNSPITVGDAWKAFLTALDINGFALIPSGKYIRIARQRDARDKQLKTYTGDFSPDTDALITRVFPLKYINSEEVARTFRSFMPANSRIIPYEQTNTVIVTDTGSNIAKLNKMLEILDVEGYDAGIEVIPVKYASAAELSKLIDTLIPGTGSPGGPPGAPRFGGGGGGRFSARRTKEGGIINTIISDERTNNLIVHANTRGADQVRELVTKLDKFQPAQTGGGKVHVVYLQFAEAEAMATTLNNLSSQAAAGGFKVTTPGAGTGTGVNPVAASLFEGSIKIAPDKATNSLVVTASPNDFATVQRVINRLDIPRDEVFVEVIVMEVKIGRDSSWSSNVISPVSGIGAITNGDLFSFIQNPISQQGAVLGFVGGAKQKINIGTTSVEVSSVQGLIKAIQTHSKTNILATPQIIALDNEEATFVSAEKIPVPTATAVQGAGVSTSVTKESVELSIKIKPQINKMSNFVKLATEIKLGDIASQAVANVGGVPVFSTLDRSAKTTVVVGDSDTIVIGGLIRDKTSETVNKIPILGDIPLLGWLFKSKESKIEKNNLLVFLTPHIVRQYDRVRKILDKKLKERDDFIEAHAGGDDPMRASRDDIIRSLPDIKALMSKKPETTFTIDEAPMGGDPGAGSTSPSDEPVPGGPAAVPVTPDGNSASVAPGVPPPMPPSSGNTAELPSGGAVLPPPPPPAPNGT